MNAAIQSPPGYANRAPTPQEALREALQSDQVRGVLEMALEREQAQPSYHPGTTFDVTAWHEGRKAVLVELIRMSEAHR